MSEILAGLGFNFNTLLIVDAFIVVYLVATVVYFFPTIVALSMGHKNVISLFTLNLCSGWTIVGWISSLVWATYVPVGYNMQSTR